VDNGKSETENGSKMMHSQAGLTILIAEDDLNLGEALAGFLRDQGHRVDLAPNGEEALELLQKNTYALVITDLVMPGADGLTVLRAAKKQDKATLVLVMTGYVSIDSAIEVIREGAYDYLRKPFKLQEITVAVANAARLLALHQENQQLQQKLSDLTDKLKNLHNPDRQAGGDEQAVVHNGDAPSFGPVGLWLSSRADQCQTDLLRLRRLYRQNQITEREYQTLKQCLRI
jgi:DNA-binding response OmpR family regulator